MRESLADGRGERYALSEAGVPITYSDVLARWENDEAFRSWFINLLRDSPYRAYRWETPAITTESIQRPFEFVLLDAAWLDGAADATPFSSYFSQGDRDGIVVFDNLGRDAVLVVPCPSAAHSAYVHLAAFVREAPEEQVHALWRVVGHVTRGQLSDRPTWLSTAGGGVSWLHVRLDLRPKYYGFAPYANSV